MIDRSQQALHLLALDPVVETTADKNSYGFRQQRSLRRCDCTVLHNAGSRTGHAVDPGSRYSQLFRPNFPRLAFGTRPYGPNHSPKVAEIRVYG